MAVTLRVRWSTVMELAGNTCNWKKNHIGWNSSFRPICLNCCHIIVTTPEFSPSDVLEGIREMTSKHRCKLQKQKMIVIKDAEPCVYAVNCTVNWTYGCNVLSSFWKFGKKKVYVVCRQCSLVTVKLGVSFPSVLHFSVCVFLYFIWWKKFRPRARQTGWKIMPPVQILK